MSYSLHGNFSHVLVLATAVFLGGATHGAFAQTSSTEVVAPGLTVTLTASAEGNPLSFQWMKEGTAIPGATGTKLVIPSVSAANNGVYNALATNDLGWALSPDLILSVTSVTAPASTMPTITLQPASATTLPEGTPFTLSSGASGSPTPVLQWLKNGTAISGATDATLSFAWVGAGDSGTYTLRATNSAGAVVSNPAVLTVTTSSAPLFSLQPVSQTAARKSDVTFTVAVSGNPTPKLQWYRNGSAIAGATNATYTLASINNSMAGTYKAVASNVAGTATSAEAKLTVK